MGIEIIAIKKRGEWYTIQGFVPAFKRVTSADVHGSAVDKVPYEEGLKLMGQALHNVAAYEASQE